MNKKFKLRRRTNRNRKAGILGPFIGHVSAFSAKIWLYCDYLENLYIQLQPGGQIAKFQFSDAHYHTAIVEFSGLEKNSTYQYRLYLDEACEKPVQLEGLDSSCLYFRTMPEFADDEDYQLDFLLMSCHDPDKIAGISRDGYEVWRNLPSILHENKELRFAILCGDQIYADAWQRKIHRAKNIKERVAVYLDVYKHFWSHPDYRRVLCRIPSYLMWDDHDIMDGWGSGELYFKRDHSDFNQKSKNMFAAAKEAFHFMQAQRNPDPLNSKISYDSAFVVGRTAVILLDLRSHRNVFYERKYGRVWLPEQLEQIKTWVEQVLPHVDTLFFVTSVVMAHGAPEVDNSVLKHWPKLLAITNFMQKLLRTPVIKYLSIFTYVFVLVNIYYWLNPIWSSLQLFLLYTVIFIATAVMWAGYWLGDMLGDLRDDIYDSWSSNRNAKEAETFLDYLFDLQNNKRHDIDVVMLSGDIHAAGYASLYSNKPAHMLRSIIPHITASPVSNQPFHWFGEAIYRAFSKTVPLGISNHYSAQISHHFTHRNVVLCSVRKREGGKRHYLKVKYYLEGFTEPQIMVFDLKDSSHKENLKWS